MFGKARAHAPHDFELNLTPVIDCFVTLICFLLLSATYANLVGMEAKVPIAVPASSAIAKKDPTFKLELTAAKGGFELSASGAGQLSGKRRLADLTAVHAELVKVKHAYPKEFSIHFSALTDMDYEQLVKIMDATRNLGPKDGEIVINDERNGKPVKVDVLFPDFVMGGSK